MVLKKIPLTNGYVRVILTAGTLLAVVVLAVMLTHERHDENYRAKGIQAMGKVDTLYLQVPILMKLIPRVDTLEARIGRIENVIFKRDGAS